MSIKYNPIKLNIDFNKDSSFGGAIKFTQPSIDATSPPISSTPVTPSPKPSMSLSPPPPIPVSAAAPLSKDAADAIAATLATHRIGFQNAGSQCYKSAVLQMFTHMAEFVSTILQLKSKVVPIPALQTLLLELNKNPTTFNPETCDIEKADLTKRLGCVATVGTQQDAAQFIDQCIFQKLSTLYETIYTDKTNSDQVLLKQFLEQCATISNTSYHLSDACLLEDKKGESQNEELFLYSVPLNGTDISDILTKSVCEKLDAPLQSYPDATHRSYNINSSGLYFIMSLKRFDNRLQKVLNPININNMIVIGTESIQYRLQGIIVHSGSTPSSGHYVYFWRINDTRWKLISDSSISDVLSMTTPEGHIKIRSTYNTEQNGYIFLYKRIAPINHYADLDPIIRARLPEPPFSSSSSSSSSSSAPLISSAPLTSTSYLITTSPTSEKDKIYANTMLSSISVKELDKIINVLNSTANKIIKVPFFSQYNTYEYYDYSPTIPGRIEAFKLHDKNVYVIHQTIEMITDGTYKFPYVLFRPHAFYIQDESRDFTFNGDLSIYNYRTGQSINQTINVHYHGKLFSPPENPIQLDAEGLDLQDGINKYFVKFIPMVSNSSSTSYIYPVESKVPDAFEGIFLIEKHPKSAKMTSGVVENSATYSLAVKGGRRRTRSNRLHWRKQTRKQYRQILN